MTQEELLKVGKNQGEWNGNRKEPIKMTAKEYLEQYKTLDVRINAKIAQAKQLRERAQYVSSTSSGGIHGAQPSDKVGELTAKIVDLEREINAEIDCLIDLKREIKERIARIPDVVYRTVLEMRYINGWSIVKISLRLNCSERTIYKTQREALESFAVYYSPFVL